MVDGTPNNSAGQGNIALVLTQTLTSSSRAPSSGTYWLVLIGAPLPPVFSPNQFLIGTALHARSSALNWLLFDQVIDSEGKRRRR
jgi:hypothetical protein